jgi:hypothetical protein
MEKRLVDFRAAKESVPINVVADAAIATGSVGEGRLIPLLVLDTSQRPDVDEFVRIHVRSAPGDVVSTWVRMSGAESRLGLWLSFSRPAELEMVVGFVLRTHGGLVDQIIRTHSFYLQPGGPDSRPDQLGGQPSILFEVAAGFSEWDRTLLRSLQRDYRRDGLSRAEAELAATQLVREWRRVFGVRVRR